MAPHHWVTVLFLLSLLGCKITAFYHTKQGQYINIFVLFLIFSLKRSLYITISVLHLYRKWEASLPFIQGYTIYSKGCSYHTQRV
nr:MAG TPA: hypothetical protein [Crassvirales sp.]